MHIYRNLIHNNSKQNVKNLVNQVLLALTFSSFSSLLEGLYDPLEEHLPLGVSGIGLLESLSNLHEGRPENGGSVFAGEHSHSKGSSDVSLIKLDFFRASP
eukprot:TRINITY_DN2244_c0_g1_i3.p2 TRINITY_DN2244_c0_g1~~TRINITY_DN2244_c0_g1_i3.p2  ORF type:complete len:101 (+),score=11.30 TRINITY_DN2244_c0_g1_i3:211-513(+)